METNQYTQELTRRFTTYSGKKFDICSDIIKYIDIAPGNVQVELFTIACKSFGIVKSQKSYKVEPSGITESEQEEMKDMYGDAIDTLLVLYIKQASKHQYSENEFYQNIWENIVCNPLFAEPSLHIFALYYLLIDKRILFYPVAESLEMENEDFKGYLEECKEDIQKIKFILAWDFDQKTQESSNLLDIILKEGSYEKQTVLLARIISELRSDDNQLLQDLLEKINI